MLLVAAIAISAALVVVCVVARARARTYVSFGILSKSHDGGDYVSLEAREIPYVLHDKLRFGLVFFKRSAVSFNAQVVHYLPNAPRALVGTIEHAAGANTDRGFRIEGPVLSYVRGGVRVLGLSEGDPHGPYEIELFVNQKLVAAIKYRVLPPVNEVATDARSGKPNA